MCVVLAVACCVVDLLCFVCYDHIQCAELCCREIMVLRHRLAVKFGLIGRFTLLLR